MTAKTESARSGLALNWRSGNGEQTRTHYLEADYYYAGRALIEVLESAESKPTLRQNVNLGFFLDSFHECPTPIATLFHCHCRQASSALTDFPQFG